MLIAIGRGWRGLFGRMLRAAIIASVLLRGCVSDFGD
jgi:hypothetical protein